MSEAFEEIQNAPPPAANDFVAPAAPAVPALPAAPSALSARGPKKAKPVDALGQFFQDSDGKLSATRLVMILWVIGTFLIWSYISIKSVALVQLPSSVVDILGILLTGKVVQKFGETSPDSP